MKECIVQSISLPANVLDESRLEKDVPKPPRGDLPVATRDASRSLRRQNGVVERWIGSCRRELLDDVIVFYERHATRLLREHITVALLCAGVQFEPYYGRFFRS